jgi:polyhydroxyalkanoate synthesis regulator phasin
MPPAKRSSSTSSKSPSAGKRTSANSASTQTAAKSGAKATATSARKAAGRTATQAKSGASKTATAAKAGAAKTSRARSGGAAATAKAAGASATSTAKTARSGAKGTATAARAGAKNVRTTAKGAVTKTRRAGSGSDSTASLGEQLAKGATKPRELVILTRDRIQETLDEAAARGRVTSKDANELVTEIVRLGRAQSDDLVSEIEALLERGRDQLESATKRARKTDPVDRIVRGADRARRVAGVGPAFPILGYDELNASQIQSRIKELSKPELRKVLSYERKHSNRKGVVGAVEKSLA